jgi:hypothetical protein
MHHWSKCVTDEGAFLNGLHQRLRIAAEDFEAFRVEVRVYRDKFVVHLDDLNEMRIPRLQTAIQSVEYLYQYLVEIEDDVEAFIDAPRSAFARYQEHLREGRAAHQA